MAIQQGQPQQPVEQQWQPSYSNEETRRLIKVHDQSPATFNEQQLESLREHAQYHNVPFYEGEFSVLEALSQAGSGFLEGFTTLRTGEHPDNEYEAVARNLGHLVGFVPGILSGPLKALGLMKYAPAKALVSLKSIPMLGADIVTKKAKKIIHPALKGALNSRFKAVDTASKFFLKEKAGHIFEGAFHLGVASSISSVWDGVDQMWESFKGGAIAGGTFRLIGNVIPGTTAGDKVIKAMAGGMFMGLPHTLRGATTPEQIYEYLAGAYFGGKETNWVRHKANQGLQEFSKQAQKNPQLEWRRQPEEMEGFENYHELVQREMKRKAEKEWGTLDRNLETAYEFMEQMGVTELIPPDKWNTDGINIISAIRKGVQHATKNKGHAVLGVAAGTGSQGSGAWSRVLEKYGLTVLNYMPETSSTKGVRSDYIDRKRKGLVKGVDRGVSQAEINEAGPAIEKANSTLERMDISKMTGDRAFDYDIIAAQYHQIKNANAVFAVGELDMSGNPKTHYRTLKKMPGWAVQMALDKGTRKVFIFDQTKGNEGWYKWSNVKDRFEAIDFAPKLLKNSAVVAPPKYKDITAEGKEAIKEVAKVTFGEKATVKSKVKGAVPEEDVLVRHAKTEENIIDLKKQLAVKFKERFDLEQDLKGDEATKIPKILRKQLEEQKKDIDKQIEGLQEEISRNETLARNQFINYEGDPTTVINDIDVGITASEFPLMKKAERFSNAFLGEYWEQETTSIAKRAKMLEAGQKVDTIIRMFQERGNKSVKDKEAAEKIEKELGVKLNSDAKMRLRRWLTELNLGEQVIYVKSKGKTGIQFTDRSKPTSGTGYDKSQIESPKLIEEVYRSVGGKLSKGVDAPIVIFDEVVRRQRDGRLVAVPLNRLFTHLKFSENMKEEDALRTMKEIKAEYIKEMDKSHNMYPFGGQGDKGRIIFAKYHPNSRDNVSSNYKEIVKNIKKNDKLAKILLDKDQKEMQKEFGVTKSQFEKMVVSNLMYDLNLNGYNDSAIFNKLSSKDILSVTGAGFIPGAIGYNKRAQIWMTNGYGGNKDFIKRKLKEIGTDDLTPDGNLRYIIVQDPSAPKGKATLKALNVELPEHVDGAILGRDDYVDAMNMDAAHPKSGQNKSFIIDNTPEKIYDKAGNHVESKNHGALLGKYMVHKVGEKASEDMKAQGLHFIIMSSAAKQHGTRTIGDYDVVSPKTTVLTSGKEIEKDWNDWISTPEWSPKANKGKGADIIRKNIPNFNPEKSKIEYAAFMNYKYNEKTKSFEDITQQMGGGLDTKGTPIYELNPESIKYNSSVVQSDHMIKKQMWVKQLFTNLHEFTQKEMSKDIIDDIYNEVIKKSFDGTKAANDAMDKYIRTLDNNSIDYLIRNLEDIGTERVITALKTPGAERFAEAALQRMLRVVEKDIEASFQEGEINAEQRSDALSNFSETITPMDRLIKNVAIVGEEAAKQGKSGFSGYMHKFVKDYKASVLHNYFIKTVTRPRQENSIVGRIRPYDKWMQRDFPDLNKSDEIFYLDGAYRHSKVRLEDGSTVFLKDIWDGRKGEYKDIANDIFTALVLRVPMDSISGAHKLKFAGFTGREGHGIMMHSRTMRALGGADLDGDEAFVYFGGKKEDGKGYGMKQSWIEAVHANKGEYYNKNKTNVEDAKNKFRDLLTISSDPNNPMKSSKALYYSPYSRMKAAQVAADGRNLLGIAVSQGQVMKSAWNSMIYAPNKSDTYDVYRKGRGGGYYRITLTPKTSAAEKKYQRELSRAQIAFASDPLDEVGLKPEAVFFNTMFDAYFNRSVQKRDKKTKQYRNLTDKEEFKWNDFELKSSGILGNYRKINSAYYGRNYNQNRRHTMDEVNQLASNVRMLSERQKNTILPKIADTLEGLDWSDNLFNRVNIESTRKAYEEINALAKNYEWLQPLMKRASFEVPYNKHIKAVLDSKIWDNAIRREVARDNSVGGLKYFVDLVRHTSWAKDLDVKDTRRKILFSKHGYEERLSMLNSMVRQAEDFMSNDLADMATLRNIDRLMKKYKYNKKKIAEIHKKVEAFKARSYLARGERRDIDYGTALWTAEQRKEYDFVQDILAFQSGKTKKKFEDLIGDERSAVWDQHQLDIKMSAYKKKLNEGERKLFDHLMIGTYNRGNVAKIYDFISQLKADPANPMLRDLVSQLVRDASRTSQSRLAFNSEIIESEAIQDHFRAMNDVYSKMWKAPSEKETNTILSESEKRVKESRLVEDDKPLDELAQGAHAGKGYAGIKKGEVTEADKKIITEIATILKEYNNKIEGNIPDLNQQIRGITEEIAGIGKDLNALNRQDFINIRNYLVQTRNGTIFQRLFGIKPSKPEIQRRYYSLFPETVDRELMAHDIKWLSKEGWFITNEGKVRKGLIKRPTYFLSILQNWVHKSNSMSTGKAEAFSLEIEKDFINLRELPEKEALFKIAASQRELGVKNIIDNMKDVDAMEKIHMKEIYDIMKNNTQAEFKWDNLKNKTFNILNDKYERIEATGYEIVNGSKTKDLLGIKEKITNRLENLYALIRGNKTIFDSYKTGKYYDPKTKSQPIMNWRKFVKDAENAFEKGEEINMDIGIDGMRHIMRSMMVELGGKNAKNYKNWRIFDTGQYAPEVYWPHMFFEKTAAEKAMRKVVNRINNDPTMTEEARKKAIDEAVLRHKSITGDWNFSDMQDFDRVDMLSLGESLERVAQSKKEKKAAENLKKSVKWTDMSPTFSSMFSRKSHVPGWSLDMQVLNAYAKNLTNTYYRQLTNIMGRKVLDEAYKRMRKKFGKDLAGRWDIYFKLYLQGAIGNPDVIPERIYNDKKMKISGTPYGWYADNRVLDRVNSIREKLGIRESDLPKELKDFTYQDLRHWSNLEAKFELAALLAHPKSSITNIFGGTLHTIASAGPGAWKKGRDIKWLQRINPNWKHKEDLDEFVVKNGVLNEFMIHELGLGKEPATQKGISKFIEEISTKLNSKDKIERKHLLEVGKKHGIYDLIVENAGKFMSVPERMLRRDAFMAHYVRAWERFGGAIRDPNHPFLIEMAKKGVKATQFLYEAPFRPFFARTALGKIMTRFHLFAWNSWRFRNDVIRQAKYYGFKPGSEAFERFKRTMQIDLFVLTLGNMFAYSLFDNSLPQPYGWLQDTSEWLLGDEKERNRAFFGQYPTSIAPLTIVTPPIARFPISGLMQWARDDYTKFTDYQVYTAFPFGRMYRDIFQADKGLLDNPSRLPEKISGIPLRDIQRFTSQSKKKKEEGTRYKQPKPGIF